MTFIKQLSDSSITHSVIKKINYYWHLLRNYWSKYFTQIIAIHSLFKSQNIVLLSHLLLVYIAHILHKLSPFIIASYHIFHANYIFLSLLYIEIILAKILSFMNGLYHTYFLQVICILSMVHSTLISHEILSFISQLFRLNYYLPFYGLYSNYCSKLIIPFLNGFYYSNCLFYLTFIMAWQ